MSRSVTRALAAWLAAGENRIGEVVILTRGEHGADAACLYEARHFLDEQEPGLRLYRGSEAAREIALYDARGEYRPLKTAPTLQRGWRLELTTLEELHAALDGFYPAMLAARLAYSQGRLAVTPLRATLARQSGMYSVTRKITDAQADTMIGEFCRTNGGCLKTILWEIAPGLRVSSLPADKFDPTATLEIPMLCAEACNLLVAKAREVVKQHQPVAAT